MGVVGDVGGCGLAFQELLEADCPLEGGKRPQNNRALQSEPGVVLFRPTTATLSRVEAGGPQVVRFAAVGALSRQFPAVLHPDVPELRFAFFVRANGFAAQVVQGALNVRLLLALVACVPGFPTVRAQLQVLESQVVQASLAEQVKGALVVLHHQCFPEH